VEKEIMWRSMIMETTLAWKKHLESYKMRLMFHSCDVELYPLLSEMEIVEIKRLNTSKLNVRIKHKENLYIMERTTAIHLKGKEKDRYYFYGLDHTGESAFIVTSTNPLFNLMHSFDWETFSLESEKVV
jgi:hypothetical protein